MSTTGNGKEALPRQACATLAPVVAPTTACLCCGPNRQVAPLDWTPHPGFGDLTLTRDGETPDEWYEFSQRVPVYVPGEWETHSRADGSTYELFTGMEVWPSLAEELTIRDVEDAVADDPGHDWRLTVWGPMRGSVYQRHNPGVWVLVENLDGEA